MPVLCWPGTDVLTDVPWLVSVAAKKCGGRPNVCGVVEGIATMATGSAIGTGLGSNIPDLDEGITW